MAVDMIPVASDGCPDGGTCHHECEGGCFRVQFCEPLSDVFPNDEWPDEMIQEHRYAQSMREAHDD